MSNVEFNNKLVLMRPDVRKARVGVVFKLMNEVKRLRNRTHGDEKQLAKCKEKARKLTKQIVSLKKLKDDKIIKMAVAETRSMLVVLADPKSGPTTRVISKIANHKAMKSKLDDIRTLFPNYQEYLNAKKIKSVKKKQQSDNSTIDKKINDDSENNDEEEATEDESDENSETEMSDDDFNSNTELQHEEGDGKWSQVKTTNAQKKVKTDKRGVKHELRDTTLPELKKCETIKPVNRLATVKRLKLDEDQIKNVEEVEKTVENSQTDAEEDENATTTVHMDRQVDSFFVTANGKSDYLQVVIPKKLHNTNDDDDENDLSVRINHHNNRDSITNDKFNKVNDKFSNRNNRQNNKSSIEFSRSNEQSKFQNKRSNNITSKNKSTVEQNNSKTTDNVHPSWAAKKKQQDILKQGFQGQKIVFDD